MIKMGSVIHHSAFENDIMEVIDEHTYLDNNYRDDSYNEPVIGWMSKEYQTRVRSKNRSKNKVAKASRKRNRK